MRVLVAPDSFKGTFSAAQVAAVVGRGLEAGGVSADRCPVADGGEGTLSVLLTALGGDTFGTVAADPLGRSRPAGFCLYRLVRDEAEILSVAVLHDFRRRGVARILLEEALRDLYREGASSIHLEVEDSNDAAISLYRRMEFSETGQRPGYYAQGRERPGGALVMRRQLR